MPSWESRARPDAFPKLIFNEESTYCDHGDETMRDRVQTIYRWATAMLVAGALPLPISGCGNAQGTDPTAEETAVEKTEDDAGTPDASAASSGNPATDGDGHDTDTSIDTKSAKVEIAPATSDAPAGDSVITDESEDSTGIWVPTDVHVKRDIGSQGNWASKDTAYEIDEQGTPQSVRIVSDGSSSDASRTDEIAVTSDGDGLVTSIVTTNLEGLSAPKQVSFSYEQDAQGRIKGIDATKGSSIRSYSLSYDDGDTLREVSGDGLTLSFDEDGRLVSEAEIGSILPSVDGEYRFDYEYNKQGDLERVTRSYPGKLGIGADTVDADFKCDEHGNLTEMTLDMEDGRIRTTYDYTYVSSPSKGAQLYWFGTSWLLSQL